MKETHRRTYKTAIAVFIAISLYIILLLLDKLFNINHKEWLSISNMYTPFFSGIAAIYVINKYAKDSIKSAKRRCIGTIIGGIFGMILMYIVEFIFLELFGFDTSNINDLIIWKIIQFSVVGISLIPLITIIKKFKLDDALFITGLTYLSVTISVRNGGMPIIQFALNRIISTLIGVGIALLVNHKDLFAYRNKNITFVCSFENHNIGDDYSFNEEEIFLTNTLYNANIDLVFSTSMTLGELGKIFTEIDCSNPLITMDGAVIYNKETKKFINVININKQVVSKLKEIINKYTTNIFTYTKVDDEMDCYYLDIINEGEKHYFKTGKENDYFKFHYGEVPSSLEVCCMDIVINDNKAKKILKEPYLINNKYISLLVEDYIIPGYTHIKIYDKNANKLHAIEEMNKDKNNKLIVIGYKENDIALMKKADLAICFNDSSEEIKECADIVLKSSKLNEALIVIKKLYRTKNIEKKILNIKNNRK